MTLRELIIKVGANTEDYDRKMVKAAGQLKRFGDDAQQIGQRLTLGISLPLAGVGIAALKASGDLEQNTIAFTTMMKSATAAQQHLESLKDFAQKTPFEFNDLVLASKRMQALGFEAREVLPSLRNIGDAAAALGMGAEGVQRIVTALGQMKAKGTVQAEEMRQLAEAGIPAWQILAKTLKTDVAGAMKLVQDRAVSAGVAVPAILQGINERFGGLMEQQSKTLLGQLSNMKDAINFTLQDVGAAMAPSAKFIMENVLQPMLNTVKGLAAGFAALPPPIAATITALGGFTALVPVLILSTGSLVTNLAAISSWLTKIGGAATVVSAALHPLTIVAATVAGLFGRIVDTWKELKKEWENDPFIQQVRGKFVDMGKALDANLERLRPTAPAFALVRTAAKNAAEGVDLVKDKIKGIPAIEKSLELALLVRQYDLMVAAHKALVEPIAALRASMGYENEDFRLLAAEMADVVYQSTRVQPSLKPLPEFIDAITDAAIADAKALADVNEQLRNLPLSTGKRNATGIDDMVTGVKGRMKEWKKEMSDFEREVRRAFDHISRDMAKNIVEWKGWKESIVNIGKDLASGFLEIMIRRLIKPLEDQFAKLAGKLAGWLGGIFGGGSSAAGSVAGGAASAGGSVAGGAKGASSAAGVAASSLGGVVNMVTGAITAVSSVIGNFQMHGINKSLDLIENYTRYLKIGLVEQNDSLLITSHKMRDSLMQLVGAMNGAVRINLDGKVTSEEANELINRLVNGSYNFYRDTFDVFSKLLTAVQNGFAQVVGQLHGIANPSIWQRLLNGSGLFGFGSMAQGLGNMTGGLFGGIASLFGGGDGKDLGRIEGNTRAAVAELTNLRSDSWAREGHLMAKLDDVWGSIRATGSNGSVNNFYFYGSDINEIMRQLKLAGVAV